MDRCKCGAQFCYVCGLRWKTCTREQWQEQRLLARATQIVDRVVDRNPGRRLHQPQRVTHQQPHSSNPRPGPSGDTGRAVSREPSVWESDWSDHSEWEQDWWQDVNDDTYTPARATSAPQSPRISEISTQGVVNNPDLRIPQFQCTQNRELRIAEAVRHLRDNHACTHYKWRWIRGTHPCEECHHVLREYIFECKQCHLRACNRCRRNRL